MGEKKQYEAWKYTLKDGSYGIVRIMNEDVSLKECIKILKYRKVKLNKIKSLEIILENEDI